MCVPRVRGQRAGWRPVTRSPGLSVRPRGPRSLLSCYAARRAAEVMSTPSPGPWPLIYILVCILTGRTDVERPVRRVGRRSPGCACGLRAPRCAGTRRAARAREPRCALWASASGLCCSLEFQTHTHNTHARVHGHTASKRPTSLIRIRRGIVGVGAGRTRARIFRARGRGPAGGAHQPAGSRSSHDTGRVGRRGKGCRRPTPSSVVGVGQRRAQQRGRGDA